MTNKAAIINLNWNEIKETSGGILDTATEFLATPFIAVEHGTEGDERESDITIGGALMAMSIVGLGVAAVAKFG